MPLKQVQVSTLLLGDAEKFDGICFTNKHVDCVHTVLFYQIGRKFVAITSHAFDVVLRAPIFEQQI